MGQLGFSIVGAAFLVGLFVPNIGWAASGKPAGYSPDLESPPLRALERIGQVLTTVAAIVFADTNPRPWSPWSWWLVAAVALMLAYETCWIRYFASDRTVMDFYRTMLGVPVPLATLPVLAFLLLGVYGRLVPLLAATVLLGIGHIGIHLQQRALATPRGAARGEPPIS